MCKISLASYDERSTVELITRIVIFSKKKKVVIENFSYVWHFLKIEKQSKIT